MRDDNFLAHDLESLKTAAREARQRHDQSQSSNQPANRTDIVHAGYRLLQCTAAGIIFIYHIAVDLSQKLPGLWDLTYIIVYPSCFFASLILAIIRIMHFIPNPNPIIPVTISVSGWLAMLAGGIMAMRHAHLELDIDILTDDEVASNPIFRHDLLLCSLSLVGSSVYLVHAWMCYDCWQWEKREKNMREAANAAQVSSSSSESESDSGMSSNSETEQNYQTNRSPSAVPGTSGAQGKSPKSGHRKLSGRASRLLNKLRRTPKPTKEETDPFATLNEILRGSVAVEQIKVEDEPVRLYCCCVDLANMIKHEYKPIHFLVPPLPVDPQSSQSCLANLSNNAVLRSNIADSLFFNVDPIVRQVLVLTYRHRLAAPHHRSSLTCRSPNVKQNGFRNETVDHQAFRIGHSLRSCGSTLSLCLRRYLIYPYVVHGHHRRICDHTGWTFRRNVDGDSSEPSSGPVLQRCWLCPIHDRWRYDD